MPADRPEPAPANRFRADHIRLLRLSLRRLAGQELCDPALDDEAAARWVYEAPFVLLSHDTAADPVFTYGNRAAQRLFELDWEQLTTLPSRRSAEAPEREERARLLNEVTQRGFICDYSGVRISRTGKRFRIARATVWNVADDAGAKIGQAAMFADWTPLE